MRLRPIGMEFQGSKTWIYPAAYACMHAHSDTTHTHIFNFSTIGVYSTVKGKPILFTNILKEKPTIPFGLITPIFGT